MARKIHLANNQFVRERIKTGVLLKRLQDNALGKLELDAKQIKSAEILLRKTLPDLSAVDANIQGQLGITVNIAR